jgi:hypothetical protein
MEFLIQPLEMGWDLVELMADNTYCPQNTAEQCGCILNEKRGCGCTAAQQSGTGPQTQ